MSRAEKFESLLARLNSEGPPRTSTGGGCHHCNWCERRHRSDWFGITSPERDPKYHASHCPWLLVLELVESKPAPAAGADPQQQLIHVLGGK